MARFILRYGQAPLAPAAHVQEITETRGVSVVDKSPNMLLVNADEPVLRAKINGLPGWSMNPEQSIPLPDTRRKPR